MSRVRISLMAEYRILNIEQEMLKWDGNFGFDIDPQAALTQFTLDLVSIREGGGEAGKVSHLPRTGE